MNLHTQYTFARNRMSRLSPINSFAVVFLVILFSSCVSQKKYNSALEEIARLSVDSVFQEYDMADMEYRKNGTIYRLDEKLDQKVEQLDSLESIVESQRQALTNRRNFLNNFNSDSWSAEEINGQVVIALKNDIIFNTASSVVSTSGKETINSIATALNSIDEPVEIWVIGHTDDRMYQTDKKDNWQLSAERALAVVRTLVDYKTDPTIITAAAKSKYNPEVPNISNAQREMNRRTEIIIVPKESPYTTVEQLMNQKL